MVTKVWKKTDEMSSEEKWEKFIHYEEMETKVLAVLKFVLSHGLVYGFIDPGPGPLLIMFYLVMAGSISLTDSYFYHTGIGMFSDKLDSRSNLRFYGSLVCTVALLSMFYGQMYMKWVGLIGGCVVYIGELLIVLEFFNIIQRLKGQQ